MEVVIALGPSTDRTDEIAAELVARGPPGRTVPNPTGRTPAGLNAAIRGSRHPIVVRVDGHGLLTPGYVATAVRLLGETGAANVGGIMHAEGETEWEQAVAAAMTSQDRRRQRGLPHRRRGRPGGHRLPGRLPARGAGTAGRLQRGVHPRPGLGAELPHPRGRRPDLVHPAAAGHLPAAAQRPGARQAVQGLRPLAPGGDPLPPRLGQPALPRPAGRPCSACCWALLLGAAVHPAFLVLPAGYLLRRSSAAPCVEGRGLAARGPRCSSRWPWRPCTCLGLGLPHQPPRARAQGDRKSALA